MSADPFSPRERLIQIAGREFFTDREGFIESFNAYVNAPETETLRALVFHGVGGIGKSTLLLKLYGDLREQAEDIVCARFNLEDSSGPSQAYRDTLLGWRAELERNFRVEFPHFDLCLSVILANAGGEPPRLVQVNPHLNSLFQFVTSAASVPLSGVGKAVETESRKHVWLETLIRKAGGTEEVIRLRQRAEASDRTLPDELLARFARDLADHLHMKREGKCCKATLFLDTYEALWAGRDKDQTSGARHLDDWVRALAAYFLHPSLRVLLVIGGRDTLQWEDDADGLTCWKRDGLLDQHLMGGLPVGDAQDFLSKCSIGQARPHSATDLQAAILRCCNETPNPRLEPACHPLYLALCAEIVLNTRAANAQNADPAPALFQNIPSANVARELADRFLKSLHDKDISLWVRELALTPRFDETCALEFAQTRRHAVGRAGWQMLVGFGFMEAEAGGRFYHMHRTMTESLCELTPDADVPAIHHAFRAHWQSRAQSEQDECASLAWYHRWELEPEPALWEWNALAEQTRQRLDMAAHLRLPDWWTPTEIESKQTPSLFEAAALNILGVEVSESSLGNRAANLRRAIGCYEAALRVRTEQAFPQDWAMTQNNLANAYSVLPTGDKAENLRRAIGCYEAALRVRTEQAFPQDWATTQNNLAVAYRNLPTGDKAQNLRRAIGCYEAALRVRTEQAFPQDWAMTQNNLAVAYQELPSGDKAENLRRAIGCYEAALRVYTEQAFPQDWATTQNNLANAYSVLPTGDKAENLRRAIGCYEAALRVYTEQAFPQDWATTQANIGIAFEQLNAIPQARTAWENAARGFRRVGMEEEARCMEEWAAGLDNGSGAPS